MLFLPIMAVFAVVLVLLAVKIVGTYREERRIKDDRSIERYRRMLQAANGGSAPPYTVWRDGTRPPVSTTRRVTPPPAPLRDGLADERWLV